MKTLKVVTGIGDNLWMFQKLINTDEKFHIKVANEDPNYRAKELFNLIPQIIESVDYDSSFNTAQALGYNQQLKNNNWRDIKEIEFWLTINHHLESGKRIETWLSDLPTTFDMREIFQTFQYQSEVEKLFSDKTQSYIGIYMSSYSTNRHWGFWNEFDWIKLINHLHVSIPEKFTFVVIGASYDLDLANSVMKLMRSKNIRYINTIGKNLMYVTEIMKKLSYGFYFPSGIGILAASLFSPHTMFFPDHLTKMKNSFQAPELIESKKVYHSDFVSPNDIYIWWSQVYDGFNKL